MVVLILGGIVFTQAQIVQQANLTIDGFDNSTLINGVVNLTQEGLQSDYPSAVAFLTQAIQEQQIIIQQQNDTINSLLGNQTLMQQALCNLNQTKFCNQLNVSLPVV